MHGFAGSPFDMKPMGEELAARGYTTHGVALAGHGPDWKNLASTTWHDWYASVERAFDELRAECDVVGVVGQSMGGLMALELAQRRRGQVRALSTLAAAIWLPSWQVRGIRKVGRAWPLNRLSIPRLGGSDIADKEMNRRLPTKGGMPIAALNQLLDAMDAIVPRIGAIDVPALVVHSPLDHTIPFACADHLATHLGGPVERLTLERSFHVISVDVERVTLIERVGEFFDRRFAPPSPT